MSSAFSALSWPLSRPRTRAYNHGNVRRRETLSEFHSDQYFSCYTPHSAAILSVARAARRLFLTLVHNVVICLSRGARRDNRSQPRSRQQGTHDLRYARMPDRVTIVTGSPGYCDPDWDIGKRVARIPCSRADDMYTNKYCKHLSLCEYTTITSSR